MRKRIICPWHQENTASLVLYKDAWRCFGACNKAYTLEEVEKKTGEKVEGYDEEEDDDKEDLSERFKYIEALPKRAVRGLQLPSDNRGYFIVWPDFSFYKYRLYDPGKGSKYLGPRGRRPPNFWARKTGKTLVLVEGEINALSVAQAMPEWAVMSPGSATMFNSENLSKSLSILTQYDNMIVVLDDDAAGIKGLIEAKAFLLYRFPFVQYLLIKPDANEILCNEGSAGLRKRLQGASYR